MGTASYGCCAVGTASGAVAVGERQVVLQGTGLCVGIHSRTDEARGKPTHVGMPRLPGHLGVGLFLGGLAEQGVTAGKSPGLDAERLLRGHATSGTKEWYDGIRHKACDKACSGVTSWETRTRRVVECARCMMG